jgi:hypothetical protein
MRAQNGSGAAVTVGVSSLYSCDDRPVPVPEGIVETLIANSDEANLALFTAGRVRVLLDMTGTAVPVALRRSAICPAA